MRFAASLLLLGVSLVAQDADVLIRDEFHKLMSAAAVTGESSARPDEAASQQNMKALASGIEDFLKRWTPRAGELRAGRLTLAKALAIAGRPAEAVPHFRAFLGTNPSAPEAEDAELALGTALLDAKDAAGAATILSAFIAQHGNSKQSSVAHHYLGLARWQLGQNDAALESLLEAVRTAGEAPIGVDAALKRLDILRDLGRVAEAKLALAALKAAHPEAPYLLALQEQLDWIGKPAPELKDIGAFVQGEATTLAALRGRVVVINFFATRYEACEAELKALAALDESSAGAAVFLGLTKHYQPLERVSAEEQNKSLAQALAAQGVKFRVAVATTFDNLRNYTVRGIPYTVIIAKDGTVAHVLAGGTRHNVRARADFAAALKRILSAQ